MTKKIYNRADELVFHALKKAFAENKIHLCLVESKINRLGAYSDFGRWSDIRSFLYGGHDYGFFQLGQEKA